MKITGITQVEIDKDKAEKDALLVIDNAQKEADELLNAVLKKIAIDKLVELSNV